MEQEAEGQSRGGLQGQEASDGPTCPVPPMVEQILKDVWGTLAGDLTCIALAPENCPYPSGSAEDPEAQRELLYQQSWATRLSASGCSRRVMS